MAFGNIVDKFHDKHGLAHTGTAEQSNLSTLHVRFEQVDDLDTGGKHFLVGREFFKLRSLAVDGVSTLHIKSLHAVDRLSDDVHHSALDLIAGRHCDRASCRQHLQVALQSVGIVHGHTTHRVFADMLLHLDDEFTSVRAINLQCLMYLWQHLLCILTSRVEIHVNDRSDDLGDASFNL